MEALAAEIALDETSSKEEAELAARAVILQTLSARQSCRVHQPARWAVATTQRQLAQKNMQLFPRALSSSLCAGDELPCGQIGRFVAG